MYTISLFPLLTACLLFQTISAAQSSSKRILEGTDDNSTRVRTDLVRLIPFDVQIAMTESDVNVFVLTDLITDWMTEAFTTKSASQGLLNNLTSFDSIALELVDQSVQKTDSSAGKEITLFTASMEGVSLWERVGDLTPPMDPALVELIQRATFLEDSPLLQLLQGADASTGLGETVVDVRAFVTFADSNSDSENTSSDASSNNQNLEIIIIIAIVVACLAFALLVFAVVWAYRSDRRSAESPTNGKRDKSSSRTSKQQSTKKGMQNTEGTGSESDFGDVAVNAVSNKKQNQRSSNTAPSKNLQTSADEKDPPTEIESANHHYPDSVISEDISTSLTAYYKSGMSGYNASAGTKPYGRYGAGGGDLNDAASVSSMDSYGYSLDGYAPSLGPAQGGYPVGPLQAARDAPVTVGDEEDTGVGEEEPEDYDVGTLTTL